VRFQRGTSCRTMRGDWPSPRTCDLHVGVTSAVFPIPRGWWRRLIRLGGSLHYTGAVQLRCDAVIMHMENEV